jgi:hypothetical protein
MAGYVLASACVFLLCLGVRSTRHLLAHCAAGSGAVAAKMAAVLVSNQSASLRFMGSVCRNGTAADLKLVR